MDRSSTQPDVFRRDRLTWVAYGMLGWFAYLQASPGLVIGHLRDELDLSYAVGGLHVTAFALGSTLASLVSTPAERALGRRGLLWTAAGVLAAGTVGLTAGRAAGVTVTSTLVMGVGGGLLLVLIQAVLADHHGERRAVALTEANVAASVAYVVLIAALSLAAALHSGWRAALLISFVVPVLIWWRSRRLAVPSAPPSAESGGRLPAIFWVAAVMLFCTTAVEWCLTAWGATFVQDAIDVGTDTAVAAMGGFFGGFVAGRVLGSRLARRHDPARLLALALVVAAAGFAVLWPSTTPAQAVVGLAVLGVGVGNLFPMGVSVALAVAPGQAGLASSRAVGASSFSIVLAPVTVGALADATSLTAALLVVPVLVVCAGVALAALSRARRICADAALTSAGGR